MTLNPEYLTGVCTTTWTRPFSFTPHSYTVDTSRWCKYHYVPRLVHLVEREISSRLPYAGIPRVTPYGHHAFGRTRIPTAKSLKSSQTPEERLRLPPGSRFPPSIIGPRGVEVIAVPEAFCLTDIEGEAPLH